LPDRPAVQDAQPDVLAQVLESARLTTLVYGRFELGAPWGIRLPDTDAAHIYVVARGGAVLEPKGAPAVVLAAGDVALLPHGGAHTLRDRANSPVRILGASDCAGHGDAPVRLGGTGAPTTLVAGAFRFGAFRRTLLLERLPAVIHIAGGDPSSTPWLPAAVQLLVAESAPGRPGGTVVVSRLVDVLLVQALRSAISGPQCAKHGLRALSDPPIARALALMHDRPGEPWTVESLGAAVGLSRSGFAARFLAGVGEPPLEYLAGWRMATAARLLRESELSTSEVAARVGYRSDAAFNRAFTRAEGTGPGAFRRAGHARR
jgi:AraC-like DNA-binding protein